MERKYTIEDVKEAYIDGYYDGAGDDAYYLDHGDEGELIAGASVHRPLKEYLKMLENIDS